MLFMPWARSGFVPMTNPRHKNRAVIRTQISLSKREYDVAKREAGRLGISLAELLRRSLWTMLPADDSKPWMRYAGMIETGDRMASQKIDDLVYGQKV